MRYPPFFRPPKTRGGRATRPAAPAAVVPSNTPAAAGTPSNAPVPADTSASTAALTNAMQALVDQLQNINPPSTFITSENKAFVERMVDIASLEDENLEAKDIDLKTGDDMIKVQLLLQALDARSTESIDSRAFRISQQISSYPFPLTCKMATVLPLASKRYHPFR
ncbi:uncharacterized protein ARB_04997 [Trichophyton benhamiae CBS 112371]|uniref:Uncharacterized protein n=1 Tax=Arthroderma benhamiae (strain ATCC MYA-4681 / CBS 112371) TaxID=663331 RepID=D4AL01_ARTBC|nr:uncharacterized protein ARB_04997 [Trichophyton benhamiae CBS 112371]EFE36060.1 hypothetical protein ARB_04997 [Trichophyton benhamiae CBS 112371]